MNDFSAAAVQSSTAVVLSNVTSRSLEEFRQGRRDWFGGSVREQGRKNISVAARQSPIASF